MGGVQIHTAKNHIKTLLFNIRVQVYSYVHICSSPYVRTRLVSEPKSLEATKGQNDKLTVVCKKRQNDKLMRRKTTEGQGSKATNFRTTNRGKYKP